MKRYVLSVMAAAGLAFAGGAAHAADCSPGKSGYDLTLEEAEKVYDCLSDELVAGYRKGGKRWIPESHVNDYRNWTRVSSAPAAPGMHSGRFLITWVNETGADAYMDYAEDPDIPAGTLIAKESFSVSDGGKVTKGPLFLMEKVEAGKSPETMDWYYMMVGANGRPQAVNVMTACNECHMETYGFQGGLGYPIEEARVAK